jgi:hypothetical protein
MNAPGYAAFHREKPSDKLACNQEVSQGHAEARGQPPPMC